MNINEQNVGEWVERFLNGETTNAEEKELYLFFAQGDVPEAMLKYKPMFSWYADGMNDPLPVQKHHKRLSLLLTRCAIAASIALIVGYGLSLYIGNQEEKSDYSCYEGSYIIRNGKKITDLKTIMPIIKRVDKASDRQEKNIEEKSNANSSLSEEQIERQAINNMANDEAKAMVKDILNDK
jgi:hypothetical protein